MFKKGFLFFSLCLIFNINVLAYNKAPIDITKLNLSEISNVLNENIITSEELINLYLDRITAYNDNFNAIITINEDAINQAKNLDKERDQGKVRSILHGIPILVKDNIDVYGMPTTGGSKFLADNYPNQNSFAVQKLIDAGAIILGKTNMSKFAFMASSSSSDYGTVKNAYNLLYSAYGSSGGSAVSVALSFAAAALGTDTNSSVRLPASANSVVGYRPTIGLISRSGVLPYDTERDTIGTITKNVEDAIIITNIIKGYDENDSKAVKDNQELNLENINLKNITIGVPTDFINGSQDNSLMENKEINESVKQLMNKSLELLKKAGASIVYIDEYYTSSKDYLVATSYSGYLFCDSFNSYIANTMGKIKSFEELAKYELTLDTYVPSCNTQATLDAKNANKEEYKNYIENIIKTNALDVIIYPSTKNKLLKIGESGIINLSAHASSTINYPSITVPMGYDEEDLPYGIEFMTTTNNDELLLNIASIYENLTTDLWKSSTLTPSLYKIDQEVSKLTLKYENNILKNNYFFKKKWIKSCQKYFENYNNNINVINDAKKLNRNYYFSIFTTFLIQAILLIVSLIILLIITLIIRKYIKKRAKKLRDSMKRKKYRK